MGHYGILWHIMVKHGEIRCLRAKSLILKGSIIGLLIRRSGVRISPGAPEYGNKNNMLAAPSGAAIFVFWLMFADC